MNFLGCFGLPKIHSTTRAARKSLNKGTLYVIYSPKSSKTFGRHEYTIKLMLINFEEELDNIIRPLSFLWGGGRVVMALRLGFLRHNP